MRSINLLAECKFEMVKTNVKKFMKKQLRKTFRDKKRLEKGVNICIYVNKRRKLWLTFSRNTLKVISHCLR